MNKTKYTLIIILILLQTLIFAEGFIDIPNNNSTYSTYLGKGGFSVIISVILDGNTVLEEKVKSPGNQNEYFLGVGATDYKNEWVFLLTKELKTKNQNLYKYNFTSKILSKLKTFEKKNVYFIGIVGDRLVINYEDEVQPVVKTLILSVNKLNLVIQAEFDNLLGIESPTTFQEKLDIKNQKLFFYKNKPTETDIISIDVENGVANTEITLKKEKGERIYLLSQKGNSFLWVSSKKGKKKYKVQSRDSQSLLFTSNEFSITENHQSFLLDEKGEYLYRLTKVFNEKKCELVEINLSTKGERIISLSKDEMAELLKNKNLELKRNKDNQIIIGHYMLDIKEKKLKKTHECKTCPK